MSSAYSSRDMGTHGKKVVGDLRMSKEVLKHKVVLMDQVADIIKQSEEKIGMLMSGDASREDLAMHDHTYQMYLKLLAGQTQKAREVDPSAVDASLGKVASWAKFHTRGEPEGSAKRHYVELFANVIWTTLLEPEKSGKVDFDARFKRDEEMYGIKYEEDATERVRAAEKGIGALMAGREVIDELVGDVDMHPDKYDREAGEYEKEWRSDKGRTKYRLKKSPADHGAVDALWDDDGAGAAGDAGVLDHSSSASRRSSRSSRRSSRVGCPDKV